MSGSAHNEVEATVETPLHRAPAECKVLATILFVVAVALVPRGELVWPYALDAALLAAVALAARTPLSLLAGRLAIEVPFVLFVVVLPFAAADFSEGPVARVRDPGQGDARGARHGRAGLDDARAGDPARRRAAARARAR